MRTWFLYFPQRRRDTEGYRSVEASFSRQLFHVGGAAVAAAGTFVENGTAGRTSCFKNLPTKCTIRSSLQRHLMEGTARNGVGRVRWAFRFRAEPYRHDRGCFGLQFFICNLLLKSLEINSQPLGNLFDILRRKLRAVPLLEHGQRRLLATDFGRQCGLSESMGTPCLPELLTDCP